MMVVIAREIKEETRDVRLPFGTVGWRSELSPLGAVAGPS